MVGLVGWCVERLKTGSKLALTDVYCCLCEGFLRCVCVDLLG